MCKTAPQNEDRPRNVPSIVVRVYTSSECVFCDEAIEVVNRATDDLSDVDRVVQVIDIGSGDDSALIPSDLAAIPTVEAGCRRIVGVPTIDEVQQLVCEALMTGRG